VNCFILDLIIRKLLPSGGRGYKIMLKPFEKAQSVSAMIGYVTKDEGKPHYQIRAHNISAQVLYMI